MTQQRALADDDRPTAPSLRLVDDVGRMAPEEPRTVRLPVVVRCSHDGCRAMVTMSPGTPPAVEVFRLEVAGWRKDGVTAWVCPRDHAAPSGRVVGPLWARLCFGVGVNLVLVALAVWPWLLLGVDEGGLLLTNAVVVTVAWWGFVGARWTNRRRRRR